MVSEANIIYKYEEMTYEKRIDYIWKHYSVFKKTIESCTEGILYRIKEEQDYNRRREKGDLGVRVQGGQIYSNPTLNEAVRNIDYRADFMNCDFSNGLLDNTDHAEAFMAQAYTLARMRRDFGLFEAQLNGIEDEVIEMIFEYLKGKKDLYDLADEWAITYDSTRRRIRIAKTTIKNNMLAFMTGDYLEDKKAC